MAENMGKRDDGKRKKRQKSFSFVRKSDEKKRESSSLFLFFCPAGMAPTSSFLLLSFFSFDGSSYVVGKWENAPLLLQPVSFSSSSSDFFFFQLEVGNRAVKGTIICENSKWQIPELGR